MVRLLGILLTALSLSGCGTGETQADTGAAPQQLIIPAQESYSESIDQTEELTYDQEAAALKITVGENTFYATFEDNPSADAFQDLLAQGAVTVEMQDYGGFEKVGSLGTELTRTDEPITTEPGDVILYQGNQITIYYGTNTWNFTRLAKIDDPEGLKEKLGVGTIRATFSLE